MLKELQEGLYWKMKSGNSSPFGELLRTGRGLRIKVRPVPAIYTLWYALSSKCFGLKGEMLPKTDKIIRENYELTWQRFT